MNEQQVEMLLARLSGGTVDAAWREFLREFSPLIMQVARRHETHPDRITDLFVLVCAALSDQGFKRLLRFRPEGLARFQTWLSVVVANLCVDARRKQHGRAGPPRAVAQLPELDQLVYRHLYVRGMRRADCLQVLRPHYPDLTAGQLSQINARLFAMLTAQQRWQLNVRAAGVVSLQDVEGTSRQGDDAPAQVEDPGPRPETLVQAEQDRRMLQAAMAKLPQPQRLILRLRFQQELTLEDIARLMQLGDAFRADRQVRAALAALAALMKD